MKDEKGFDEKILAVPIDALHPYYTSVKEYSDLPDILLEQISHFFTHYKDLETDKWVKLDGWENANAAVKFIEESINRAKTVKL